MIWHLPLPVLSISAHLNCVLTFCGFFSCQASINAVFCRQTLEIGKIRRPLMLFSIYKNSVSSLSAKLGLLCPAILVLCAFLFFDLKDPHYIFLPSFFLSSFVIIISEYTTSYFLHTQN